MMKYKALRPFSASLNGATTDYFQVGDELDDKSCSDDLVDALLKRECIEQVSEKKAVKVQENKAVKVQENKSSKFKKSAHRK